MRTGRTIWIDRVALVLGALVLFLLLGRKVLTPGGLLCLVRFHPDVVFTDVLRISALSTALSIGLAHATAWRLTGSRAAALCLTGLVLTLPAIWFSGTLVDRFPIGVLLIFGSYWLTTLVWVRTSIWCALLLGACSSAAAGVDPPLLCLPLLLLWFAFSADRSNRPRPLWIGLYLLTHVALVIYWWAPQLRAVWLAGLHLRSLDAGAVLWPLLTEGVRPLLPVSLLLIVLLVRLGTRLLTATLLLASLPSLAVACVLARTHLTTGQLLLPVALPCAWLVERHCTFRTCLCAMVLAALAAALALAPKTGHPESPGFAEGYRQFADAAPPHMVWLPNPVENEAYFIQVPSTRWLDANALSPARLIEEIELRLERGEPVAIGLHTQAALLTAQAGSRRDLQLQALSKRYRWEFVQRGRFRAYRLVPPTTDQK